MVRKIIVGRGLLSVLVMCTTAVSMMAQTTKEHLENAKVHLFKQTPDCYNAIKELEKVLEKASNSFEANWYAGICYYTIGVIDKAEQTLKKALQLKPKKVQDEAYLLLGRVYQYKYDCDRAETYFKEYLRRLSDKEEKKKRVDRLVFYALTREPILTPAAKITMFDLGNLTRDYIKKCYRIREIAADTTDDAEMVNLGPNVNSIYPDYGPVITADNKELYFTSRRPGGITDELAPDGFPFEDIWVSRWNEQDSAWGPAENVGEPVNSEFHESIVSISVDKKTMIIYRGDNNGDLYISRFIDGLWTEPEPMPKPINSRWQEKTGVFSPDGKAFYFVSDRKGTKGGLDIWVSYWDEEKGEWGDPINLGDSINTPLNEDGIFLHPDGKTLYFSSQGHNSIGGYDVFKSTYRHGKWTKAKNLGVPLNSPGDDIYFVVSSDGNYGYMSSERFGTLGEKDIFLVKLTEAQKPEQFFVLIKGVIHDQFTEEPIYSEIFVIDSATGDTIWKGFSDSKTGEFVASVPVGKSYIVRIKANDYVDYTDKFFIPDTVRYVERDYQVYLKPLKIMLLGQITDASTKEPLRATVFIWDNETGDTIMIKETDQYGVFKATLPLGKNYGIQFEKEGYLWYSANLYVPDTLEQFFKEYYVELEPITVGAKVALRNIFFEFGSAELKEESYTELQKAIEFLNKYPYVVVELAGHTDSVGSEEYNLKLSQRRAEAVKNYLVQHGISPDRLVAKGYGESQPIAPNTNPDGTDNPEGRALNRRVEFRIIEIRKEP